MDKKTFLEGKNKIGNTKICSSDIGFGSYIISGSLCNCRVGRFCSIGHNINIITATHQINYVSSFPGFYKTKNKDIFLVNNDIHINEMKLCPSGKAVEIGNDVWIADNVTILGGVTIGDGAVVGANALVTKDVPPYSVVGGVPAKILKQRFSDQVIQELLRIKWWNWDIAKIQKESSKFNNVEQFIKDNNALEK